MNQAHHSRHHRPQVIRRTTRDSSDSALCNHGAHACHQPRIDGYEFCVRHILEDKNAPYRQCQYTSYKTNKRCTSAGQRGDKKDGYCAEHARRAAHIRMFINRKRRPKQSPESLIDDLSNYGTASKATAATPDTHKKSRGGGSGGGESASNKILDYASSSDSEAEGFLAETYWCGDGDSDAESVDSEQEDPLKHAGVYTAEEVALITRDKLIRLQSLYIDQFKRLQHVMKEKRRRFLHTVRKEHEALGSIHYAKHDPEQSSKYDKLVAMKRYHRRYGQEALLHRESKERRIAVSEGSNYKPPSYPKCIFTRHNTKCGARTIPLSKYCKQHIVSDPHQILYRPCALGEVCTRPIAELWDNTRCRYHALPQAIDYRLPRHKEEVKEECRDEIDVVGGIQDIKTEDGDQQSLQLKLQLQYQKEQLKGSPLVKQAEQIGLLQQQQDQLALLQQQNSIATVNGNRGSAASATISKAPSEESTSKPQVSLNPLTATSTAVTASPSATSDTGDSHTPGSGSSTSKVPVLLPKPPASLPPISVKLGSGMQGAGSCVLSPTKSAQVPSVVSDLLAREKHPHRKRNLPPPITLTSRVPRDEMPPAIKKVPQEWVKIPTMVKHAGKTKDGRMVSKSASATKTSSSDVSVDTGKRKLSTEFMELQGGTESKKTHQDPASSVALPTAQEIAKSSALELTSEADSSDANPKSRHMEIAPSTVVGESGSSSMTSVTSMHCQEDTAKDKTPVPCVDKPSTDNWIEGHENTDKKTEVSATTESQRELNQSNH